MLLFKDYLKNLNSINNDNEKLSFVLNDILIHRLDADIYPIFKGTFIKEDNNIQEITDLYGNILNYPYNTYRYFFVSADNLNYKNDTKVLFLPMLDSCKDVNNLLKTDSSICRSFDELHLNETSSIDEILNAIQLDEEFNQALTSEPYSLLKRYTNAQDINKQIKHNRRRLRDIGSELEKKKMYFEELEKKMEQYKSLGLYESTYKTEFLSKGMINSGLDLTRINSKLPYKYDQNKVERFLMALNTDQIIVLSGDPGTGKTTFARKMADAIGAKCTMIQVQSNWTDASDLMGYYNPMQGTYHSTPFLDALIEARNEYEQLEEKSRLHIICLDEMNLAKVEYYFASFLSILTYEKADADRTIRLLPYSINKWVNNRLKEHEKGINDEDKRKTSLLADYRDFQLPPNVRFVGTLNMDDTTNMLSPKVIDRSFFIEFKRGDGDSVNEKFQPNDESYYPYTQFEQDPSSYNSVFKNENPRFEKFAKKMYALHTVLGLSDDMFADLSALSKLLPAINSEVDWGKFNDNYKEYLNVSEPDKSKWPLTSARCGKIQSSYWID